MGWANARALAGGEERLEVTLHGEPFGENVQKYHARSLGKIREKFAGVPDRSRLEAMLAGTGCLDFLAG